MEPTQSIKVGYSSAMYQDMEPRAESRLNVLRLAMNVLRYGAENRKPIQGIKIGNACIKIGSRLKIGTGSRVIVLRYVMHVLR